MKKPPTNSPKFKDWRSKADYWRDPKRLQEIRNPSPIAPSDYTNDTWNNSEDPVQEDTLANILSEANIFESTGYEQSHDYVQPHGDDRKSESPLEDHLDDVASLFGASDEEKVLDPDTESRLKESDVPEALHADTTPQKEAQDIVATPQNEEIVQKTEKTYAEDATETGACKCI